ncbi:phosphatidylinositol kinase [Chloropicon primus]|nr:phosphatidylinositol kinase [Chloropicon primus]
MEEGEVIVSAEGFSPGNLGILINGSNPPTAAAAAGGGRRDSGITLLSLLQDLTSHLTDGKQTQADYEAVGTRFASLLPNLLEEFCERETIDKREILSICSLTKLAVKQFTPIFGPSQDLTVYWVIRYFIHLCKACDSLESSQAVARVFFALVEHASESKAVSRSVLAGTSAAVRELAAHASYLLKAGRRGTAGGTSTPLTVFGFREAFQRLGGEDDDKNRELGLVAMDRKDIKSGLALTLTSFHQVECSLKVLLDVLAYSMDQSSCSTIPLGRENLIDSVLNLLDQCDGLFPHCCRALHSIARLAGAHAYPWGGAMDTVLQKTCALLSSQPLLCDHYFDKCVAGLLRFFQRSIPSAQRSKNISNYVVFLCCNCAKFSQTSDLPRALCEMVLDVSSTGGAQGTNMEELVMFLMTTANNPLLLQNAMKFMIKERESKALQTQSEENLSLLENRKRANSEDTGEVDRKRMRRGSERASSSKTSRLADSLHTRPALNFRSSDDLKKFCVEAESITNATDRMEYLGILVFLRSLGQSILDEAVTDRIERSVWHILSLYENDLERRNEGMAVLQILRIIGPFASLSFLPKTCRPKTFLSMLLSPWNTQNASKGSKFGAIKLGMAASWHKTGYKQLLDIGLQDKNESVRAAIIIAAPGLIGRPHCSQMSGIFSQMSRDSSARVRVAIGCSLAIAYVLDLDLKEPERLSVLSLVKKMVGEEGRSTPELLLSFQGFSGGRKTAQQKSKNLFKLNQWGLVTKYLLFSEQDEDVQIAVLQSLRIVFSSCHPKEVAGSGTFLIELLDWVLNDEGSKGKSKRFHAISSEVVQQMVSKPFLEEMFPGVKSSEFSFLQRMRSDLQKSKTPVAKQLILRVIASVGATPHSQDCLLIALVLLVGFLDNRDWRIKSAAARGLKHIADANQTSLASLISKNPRTLEYIGRNLVNKPRLAREAADVLFNLDEKSLLVLSMPFVLPTLIELQDTKALEALANSVQASSLSEMLLEYGYHAMAEIFVVGADNEQFEAFVNYMEKLTSWGFNSQLDASLHNLLMQVLWKASGLDVEWKNSIIPDDVLTRMKETLSAIAVIVQKLQPPSEPSPSSDSDAVGFLQSEHISMILKGVSDHLKDSGVRQALATSLSPNKEVQAIRCLNIMIELSGHHVKEFTPGFLALLTKGLEVEDEQARIHSVQGFTYFVDALASADPSQLKRIVEPIVVALLPFLEASESPNMNMHDAVIRLMERLVIKYQDQIQTKLRGFPLLPSTPDLNKVNEVIQKSKGKMDESNHLRAIIESLGHDAISVKYSALGELKTFLVLQQEWINRLINSGEESDKTLMNDLLHALFKCSKADLRSKRSLDFSLRCLECLGEVGAIDPRKCTLSIAMEQTLLMAMKSKMSLPASLITSKLSKVLSSTTDLDALDSTAYAIQQILKYYGQPNKTSKGSDDTQESNRNATQSGLWDELSEDVQGVIRPLLKSKYHLTTKMPEKLPVPIIGLFGLTYERWLLLWMRHLITCVPKDHEFRHLFEACSGMLKYDLSTMLFLLPYLILVVVTCGTTDAVRSVKEELKAAVRLGTDVTDVSQDVELRGKSPSRSHLPAKREGDLSFFTLSMQTIFSLLDQFSNWLILTKQFVNKKNSVTELSKTMQSLSIPATTKSIDRVSKLLESVPQISLAHAAYNCGAHARALKHYEMHLRDEVKCKGLNPPAFDGKFNIPDQDLSFLIETYSHLEEPDGIGGLIGMREESRLCDKTLAAEKAGNWSEVLAIYEEALQDGASGDGFMSDGIQDVMSDDERGYLRCLLNMGHHQAMITHISGLTAQFQDKPRTQQLSSYAIASALRLGRWNLLNDLREVSDAASAQASGLDFDVQVASLLQEVPNDAGLNEENFKSKLEMVRKDLLGPLSASSMESYLRVYPVLRRLQVLQEVENAYSFISKINFKKKKLNLKDMERQLGWKERLERTQPSLATREPLMAVRRAIMSFWIPKAESLKMSDQKKNQLLKDQDKFIGSHLLEYAKLCRKAGYHEAAQIAILKAESKHKGIDASLSKAKLLWDMDKKLDAISELKSSLKRPDTSPHETAKKTLHLAHWSSLTGHEQEANLMHLYEQAIVFDPEWEKGYFFFARYVDDLMRDAQQREKSGTGDGEGLRGLHSIRVSRLKHFTQPKKHYEYIPLVLKNYGECIQHGTKTIYQSMPRMLTVWFEFGNEVVRMEKSRTPIPKEIAVKVSDLMLSFLKKVPKAVWLAALPQLISRICHPHPDVLKFTKHILSRTLHAYPDQVLWHLATVANSNVPQRRKGAKEVITAARKRANDDKRQLFQQFERLIDELIRLCHHAPSGKAKTFSISQNFRTLERMMPLDILIPVQNALTLALPPNGVPFGGEPTPGGSGGKSARLSPSALPFESSSHHVTIAQIFDEVEILNSLQKPKVIKVLGSDGREYKFLCKPKDDLRKDTRMMEFANVLNHLLATKSHHLGNASRNLYIRTFAVMPLTEDCGMIEWIENTRGFRHCCQDVYIQENMFDRRTNRQIKDMYDAHFRKQASGTSIKKAREHGFHAQLLDKVLDRFPPRLHKWFLQHFSEPSSWLEARLKFSRSCAVWSVCGHVVGLGDRHGENVLIDSSTGDCVHVDFSCLFDKGLALEKPEVVPFRLTQNMIDAMGVSGYEGVFRKSCETTLRVLRSNKETLLNVLETFVHDPLVEWTHHGTQAGAQASTTNTYARQAMANIASRLSGVVVGVNANPSLPLSAEGQTDRLIAEATSKENLGMMYIWWMPWF